MINPWKVLGVHRKSTDEEIKLAYHALAKKYHPDVRKNKVIEFLCVSEAYRLIKTKESRNVFIGKFGGNACGSCAGRGYTSKSSGLTEKIYKACPTCSGAGILIKNKEDENVIELQSTTSPSRKGRNTKRRP